MEKYIGTIEFDEDEIGEDVPTYLEVVLKDGYLIAGTAGNGGIFEHFRMKYDDDYSLDENLQDFYDYLSEKLRNNIKYDSKRHTHSAHRAIERGAIKGSKRMDSRRPRPTRKADDGYCVRTEALKRHHTRDSIKRRHTRDSLNHRRVIRRHR